MPRGDADPVGDDSGSLGAGDSPPVPTKVRVPYGDAKETADALVRRLKESGLFRQVEVAGSLRRGGRETVGDVEIVAEWRTLSGTPDMAFLDQVLQAAGVERGPPTANKRKAPWGSRYRRCVVYGRVPIPIDLFMVYPPATWGVILTIRTGCAEFSQALVTRVRRFGLRVDSGRVLDLAGVSQDTPTEESVFEIAHLPWIPPGQREVSNRALRPYFGPPW